MLVLAWPGTAVILPNPRQDQELRVQEGSVLKSKSEEGGREFGSRVPRCVLKASS